MASAAEFSGYATEYPERLAATTNKYTEFRSEAKETTGRLESYPGELTEPNWGSVGLIYERADKYGRTGPFAESFKEDEVLESFFESERDEMARRVTGAVKNEMDKDLCTCELEIYGKITYALKDSITKRRSKRLQDKNEAHILLERSNKEVGKKNEAALVKQIDSISRTSYITFIALPELRIEIEQLLDEARQVKKTIDNALDSEREFVAHPSVEPPDKKAAEKRIETLEAAKASLEPAVEAAEQLLAENQEEILTIRQAYEDAMEKLLWAVEQKQEAQEKGGG